MPGRERPRPFGNTSLSTRYREVREDTDRSGRSQGPEGQEEGLGEESIPLGSSVA